MSSLPVKQALVDIHYVQKKGRMEEDMSGEERRGEERIWEKEAIEEAR